MQTKILEIRDRATFIPVLAIEMRAETEEERYYLRRTGFGQDDPLVLVSRLTDAKSTAWDPYSWGDRTMHVAHKYITEHFKELKTGDVVDVEYILNEKTSPKYSERYT